MLLFRDCGFDCKGTTTVIQTIDGFVEVLYSQRTSAESRDWP